MSAKIQMAAVYTTVPTWKEAISAPALRDLLWISMVEAVKVSQLVLGLLTVELCTLSSSI